MTDDAVRRRQAYVSLDKIEEALDHQEDADALAAARRLVETLEDLS